MRRLGEIHHLVMQPLGNAASAFIAACKTEFGAEGELIATDLLGGFPNRSLDSANGLWYLAQTAKALPDVEALLRANSPSQFLERLDAVKGGAKFRARLDAYLDEFGHRNESFSELSFPTWREEPKFPLFIVRRYLDAAADKSPTAMNRQVEQRREARLAEVLPKLSGDGEKRDEFERLMRIAQQRTVLLEDHNFYIDQQAPAASRAVCLAYGTRLAARGAIAKADDVFYLEEADVLAAQDKPGVDYRAVVDARRAGRDYWMRKLPPASIGQGPVRMPPQMEQFFGPVANEPMEAGAFKGVAGSAGMVRGTARLILTLDDIDRLAPGEILVTYATAPPWTPAFAVAGGIVTDIGGTLSHCAVVAREYGIPAVVGTRIATATIQDGQLITVDGTAGIVRLEG
jgi:pyruvate,water dikinase